MKVGFAKGIGVGLLTHIHFTKCKIVARHPQPFLTFSRFLDTREHLQSTYEVSFTPSGQNFFEVLGFRG